VKPSNDEIALEIYAKMYREATPSADIHKIMESGEGKKQGWFDNYYLSLERQVEIINEFMEKYKIVKWKRYKWHSEILLGASPSSTLLRGKQDA
jgi:hypothetical protein